MTDQYQQACAKRFREAIKAAHSPDERLLAAMSHDYLEGFRKAVADGANVNVIDPGTGYPLIFSLAEPSKMEWVKCLIETQRCNLLVFDREGMPPSHRPGVFALDLNRHGATETGARLAEVSNLLLQEEKRQVREKGSRGEAWSFSQN